MILGVIALIVAVGGTAIAAGGLTPTQKKEVTKIAKKYAGKQGPVGPTGPAGANGTNGKDGTNGTNGTDGQNGTPGKSVKLVNSSPVTCEEGGFTYEVEGSATKNEVCNGKEGSPWTAGGVLPAGATERGTWAGDGDNRLIYSLNEVTGELEATEINTFTLIPISFALPVVPAPTEAIYSKQLEEEAQLGEPVAPVAGCPGLDEEGLPMADSGKLCVYQMSGSTEAAPTFFAGTKVFPTEQGPDSMGTVAGFSCPSHNCRWLGVWAVTAE